MCHTYFTNFILPPASRSSRSGSKNPARSPMNVRKFCIAMFFLLTPVVSSFAQERKVPIDIKITVNKSIPITGNEVQVTLEVIPLVAVKSAKVAFTATDNISLRGQKEFELGQLNANTKKVFTSKATLTANGRGILTGSFEIITKEGYKLGASRAIYFLINIGNSFYGQGSFVTAQSDSIKYKLRSSRLTPEAYEQEYKKALKKAVNGDGPFGVNNTLTKQKNVGAKIAAVSTFIVSGTITWATPPPTSIQPVKFATVEIWDNKSNTLLDVDVTDATGFYFKTITGNSPDIYIKTFAKSPYFFIVQEGQRSDESMTYFDKSPIISNVSSSTTLSRTIPYDLTQAKYNAFSIHSALIESIEYVKTREPSASLPKFSVEFPISSGNTRFSSAINNMYVLNGDRFDWDVIHHEYGHYIASQFGIAIGSPGGGHSVFDHLAEPFNTTTGPRTLSKKDGFALAWSEAWPSYFGTTLQKARGLDKNLFRGVGAGDELYEDTDDASISYSLEGGMLILV